MKFIIYCLLLLLTGCFDQQTKTNSPVPIKIDSSWKKKTISNVLTISLPDSVMTDQLKYTRSTFAESRSGLYGVDYYDTIFAYVTNEKEFKLALKGYLGAQFMDIIIKSYELNAFDTTIGNLPGYFVTGYSDDSMDASCKYRFFYLTLANNNFYWFYACQTSPAMTNETRQFFHSIQFNAEIVKESEYHLPPTRIRKRAGSRTAG